MIAFTFENPTKIVFGVGCLDKAGDEAAALGRRALILTGKQSARSHGYLERLVGSLSAAGVDSTVFPEVEPNPHCTTIDRAAELARSERCEFVIGLGGGSPMDAAKGVAVAARVTGRIWDFVPCGTGETRPVTAALPIMEIPTLAATGSETNSIAVINNPETREKAIIEHPLLFPKVAIVDPALTVSVPRDYVIDGAVDICSHVIEGYFTGVENAEIQNRMSLSIVRTVMDLLPRVLLRPDDLDARAQLSLCSTLALQGWINLGRQDAWPLHALEHVLSAHYDISHGRGLALLLPRLMAYTRQARPERFALMARELFGASEAQKGDESKMAVTGMVNFLSSVDRYLIMSDIGIPDDSKFELMAQDAIRIDGTPEGNLPNPRPLYREDIVIIFHMCTSRDLCHDD